MYILFSLSQGQNIWNKVKQTDHESTVVKDPGVGNNGDDDHHSKQQHQGIHLHPVNDLFSAGAL